MSTKEYHIYLSSEWGVSQKKSIIYLAERLLHYCFPHMHHACMCVANLAS
jgi:hypothetical protein